MTMPNVQLNWRSAAPPLVAGSKRTIANSTVSPTIEALRERLRTASLFKEDAFINGEWVGAAGGKTFEVR